MSDIQQEFEEQLRQMTEMLSQYNRASTDSSNSMRNYSTATNTQINSLNRLNTVTNGQTKAAEAAALAHEKMTMASNNFRNALGGAQMATTSFGRAMITSEQGVKKYGDAIGKIGESAGNIGKNFGLLGGIIGGAVAGMTAFASAALDMHDKMIQMNREATNFAGVIPGTSRSLADLSKQAGYAGDGMGKLIGITKTIGADLVALGGTAGSGVIQFTRLANVGNDVYESFAKMGVSQEELTKMQSYYVKMQSVSGKAYELQSKDMGTLRRESLSYAEELIRITSMTGETADQMQRERETIKAEIEERVRINSENSRIRQLEVSGRMDEAAAIKNEQNTRSIIMEKMLTHTDKEAASMVNRLLGNKVFDEFTGGLATMNLDIGKTIAQMKRASTAKEQEIVANELVNKYLKATQTQVDNLAYPLMMNGAPLAKELGVTAGTIDKSNKMLGKTVEEREKLAKDQMNTEKTQADKAAEEQSKIETAQRELVGKWQDAMLKLAEYTLPVVRWTLEKLNATISIVQAKLIDLASKTISFLRTNMDNLTSSAKIAGTALLAFAGVKVIGAATSGFGSLKTATNGLVAAFQRAAGRLAGMGTGSGGILGDATGNSGKIGKAGKLAKIGKGLLTGIGGILGGLALDYAGDSLSENGYTKSGAVAKIGSSTLAGAGMGAMLGPLGAAAGGVLGAGYGLYQNWDAFSVPNSAEKVEKVKLANQSLEGAKEHVDVITQANKLTATKNDYDKQKMEQDLFISKTMSDSMIMFKNKVDLTSLALQAFANSLSGMSGTMGTAGYAGGGSGDVITAAMNAMKDSESGGDYRAKSPHGSASGAYQFTDASWQGYSKKYGIGTEFKRAMDAPADVQDALARAAMSDIYAKGGLAAIPNTWYTGNAAGNISPEAMKLNGGLTPQANAQKFMRLFNKHMGASAGVGGLPSGNIVTLGAALQAAGYSVSEQSAFGGVTGGVHKGIGHAKDKAIDVNIGTGNVEMNDPTMKAKFDSLAAMVKSAGYKVIWGGKDHNDHMHIEESGIQAAKGGVFSGPSSGYPATLHGTEMITPMSANSVLMKLAKTPASSVDGSALGNPSGGPVTPTIEKIVDNNVKMIELLSMKIDTMIDVLESGNDIRTQILRHAKV